MSPKAFIFLGLLLAFVLLLSSEAAAAGDLAEISSKNADNKVTVGVEDAKYGGYDIPYGGGFGEGGGDPLFGVSLGGYGGGHDRPWARGYRGSYGGGHGGYLSQGSYGGVGG